MNVDKVNAVLTKAISHFQISEIQAMQATIDDLTEDADGSEALNSYVVKTLATALSKTESTDDEVIDAMFEIIEAAIESGKLPQFPDEEAEEEAWVEWVGKATEAGLADATTSLLQKRAAA